MLTKFFASLSSIEFYQTNLKESVWKSLKYYLAMFSLLWIGISIFNFFKYFPAAQELITNSISEIRNQYPSDLILSWDGESLNSSITPLSVSYPTFFNPSEWLLPENFIEINTHQSDFEIKENTLLSVTSDSLTINSMGNQEQFSLPELLGNQSFELNREVAVNFIDQTSQSDIRNWLLTIALILSFISWIGVLFSRLILALVESFIGYLMLNITGRKEGYWRIFQISLYILIPAEIIYQTSVQVVPDFASAFLTLSFWVMFLAILFSLRRDQALSQS